MNRDEPPNPQFQVMHLIGRLTQDVELRERGETKVAQLRLAVPRGRDKNGEDRGADFVDVVCFGRQAEVCSRIPRQGPADRRRGSPAPRRVGRRERPPPEARGHRAERRVPRRPQAPTAEPTEQTEPAAA